jgi:hypothetical protein
MKALQVVCYTLAGLFVVGGAITFAGGYTSQGAGIAVNGVICGVCGYLVSRLRRTPR